MPAINWQFRHISSSHMVVKHLLSLVGRRGTHCRIVYQIHPTALLFLAVYTKHSHSQSTNVHSALEEIWILLKQETVSGTVINWAICKSAPRSRQITMPAPYHSVFTGRTPFLLPKQLKSTEGFGWMTKRETCRGFLGWRSGWDWIAGLPSEKHCRSAGHCTMRRACHRHHAVQSWH